MKEARVPEPVGAIQPNVACELAWSFGRYLEMGRGDAVETDGGVERVDALICARSGSTRAKNRESLWSETPEFHPPPSLIR